ncbi:MAG: DUF11 domain-containing protein [Actinomycetota bacterium]
MSHLASKLRRDQGSALVIALIMITTVGLTVASLISFSGATFKTAEAVGRPNRDRYSGDAAVEASIERLRVDPNIGSNTVQACADLPTTPPKAAGEFLNGTQIVIECTAQANPGEVILASCLDSCDSGAGGFTILLAKVSFDDVSQTAKLESYGPPRSADLAVSISDSVDPWDPIAQPELTYTVTVENNGPDDASGVRLADADTTPGAVTFTGATTTQGTCAFHPMNGVDCDLGPMQAGSSVNVEVTVASPTGTSTTNRATVDARYEQDPETADNIDLEQTQIG